MRGNVVQEGGLNIVGSEVISVEFAESLVKGEPVEIKDVLEMENPTKLADPSTLPAGDGSGAAFSPDGTYLAVANSTSPFITIYKRSGDTFVKLADPSVLPASQAQGAAFSPDGACLAVAHYNSPFITIYEGTLKTLSSKIQNLAYLTDGASLGITKQAGSIGETKQVVKVVGW